MEDQPEISVIIPARNEEFNLARCLDSLVRQEGVCFEIIVVDDHSSDKTRQIAESFPQVRVMPARPLPPNWTGKQNAIDTAIPFARGRWLLFTDADTFHLPGSLRRGLVEAEEHGVSMLSYSPKQDACTFWERAVQPVVFAELNRSFCYDDINDPNSQSAAANGQYLLIKRSLYDQVGGHAGIKSSLLEDVALAHAVKARGGRLRFRYAPDAVSARMYHGLKELIAGWKKNLAVLFPNIFLLGLIRLVEAVILWLGPPLAVAAFVEARWYLAMLIVLLTTFFYVSFIRRLKKAGWHFLKYPSSLVGLPLFSFLLFRSYFSYSVRKNVTWKGRSYST